MSENTIDNTESKGEPIEFDSFVEDYQNKNVRARTSFGVPLHAGERYMLKLIADNFNIDSHAQVMRILLERSFADLFGDESLIQVKEQFNELFE